MAGRRKSGEAVQVVLARAENTGLEPTGRIVKHPDGVNYRHETRAVPEGKAAMWARAGTAEDVAKAKAHAAKEGWTVLTYPASEKDPLGKARDHVVTAAKSPLSQEAAKAAVEGLKDATKPQSMVDRHPGLKESMAALRKKSPNDVLPKGKMSAEQMKATARMHDVMHYPGMTKTALADAIRAKGSKSATPADPAVIDRFERISKSMASDREHIAKQYPDLPKGMLNQSMERIREHIDEKGLRPAKPQSALERAMATSEARAKSSSPSPVAQSGKGTARASYGEPGYQAPGTREQNEKYWSSRAERPPTVNELPPNAFNGTQEEFSKFSPGMRREIERQALKRLEATKTEKSAPMQGMAALGAAKPPLSGTHTLMGIPADGSKPFVMAKLDSPGDQRAHAERIYKDTSHLYTQKLAGYQVQDKFGNVVHGWSDAARAASAKERGVALPGEAKPKAAKGKGKASLPEGLPTHVARFGEKHAVKADKSGKLYLAKRGEKTPVSADAVKGLEAWDAYKARQAEAKGSKTKAAKAPKPTIDTSGVKTAALKGAPSHEVAAVAGVNARKPEMLAKIEFGNSKPTAQQLDAFREVHGHTVKTASGFKFKSTWYTPPTTAGGQPMDPLSVREKRYTDWLKAGKPKTGPGALALGLLAPVGIAASMLAASNDAKAAGAGAGGQLKAAGAEGAKSAGTMAAFMGGTALAAKGLMAAGVTAAKAVPVVNAAMIAGGAIHGAITAKPGERMAGAAKGAWDMSLPGMAWNTGKAASEAISSRFGPDKAAAFEQANATWNEAHKGMQNAPDQGEQGSGLRGTQNPTNMAAVLAGQGKQWSGEYSTEPKPKR